MPHLKARVAAANLGMLALVVLVQTSTDSGFLVVSSVRMFLFSFIYSFISGLGRDFHFGTVSCSGI